VLGELPPPPSRVLEVGCGDGRDDETFAKAGYDVTAIDPKAPDGEIFRRTTLEEFDEGTFDAVVASVSLHHVEDLAAAFDKVATLLHPGGALVLETAGGEQARQAAALLRATGLTGVTTRADLAGVERFVAGVEPA